MWKQLGVGLVAVLLVAGLLSAADNSWRFPVPTLGGLVAGDLIYARDRNNLGNISAVAAGQVLTSAGTSTIPAWSANPTVTGYVGVTSRTPVPTQVSSTVLLFASAMSGKTVLFAMLPGGSIRALATQP